MQTVFWTFFHFHPLDIVEQQPENRHTYLSKAFITMDQLSGVWFLFGVQIEAAS